MESNKEPIDFLLMKLLNSLKGSAMMVRDANDMMYTPEQRRAEFDAIEQLTVYVRDYKTNIRKLAEYKDMQDRLIDDGR